MVYYRMVWGESMKVEAIRVWGDSILKGIVFDSARKRYTIIKDNALSLLSEKVVTPIQNFSRMGATAPEALKALKAKLADASLENQIVVFAATTAISIGKPWRTRRRRSINPKRRWRCLRMFCTSLFRWFRARAARRFFARFRRLTARAISPGSRAMD